jgi:hypothetical protein
MHLNFYKLIMYVDNIKGIMNEDAITEVVPYSVSLLLYFLHLVVDIVILINTHIHTLSLSLSLSLFLSLSLIQTILITRVTKFRDALPIISHRQH